MACMRCSLVLFCQKSICTQYTKQNDDIIEQIKENVGHGCDMIGLQDNQLFEYAVYVGFTVP